MWKAKAAILKLFSFILYSRIGELLSVANVALELAYDLSNYIMGVAFFTGSGIAPCPSFRRTK